MFWGKHQGQLPNTSPEILPSEIMNHIRFLSDDVDIGTYIDNEVDYLKRFSFEYFIHMVGSAPVTGRSILGSSVKKTATDKTQESRAYQIYSCGIYKSGPLSEKMLIPLETVVMIGN